VRDWPPNDATISPINATGVSLNDETRFPKLCDWHFDLHPLRSGQSTATPASVIAQHPNGNVQAVRQTVTPQQFVFHATGLRSRAAMAWCPRWTTTCFLHACCRMAVSWMVTEPAPSSSTEGAVESTSSGSESRSASRPSANRIQNSLAGRPDGRPRNQPGQRCAREQRTRIDSRLLRQPSEQWCV